MRGGSCCGRRESKAVCAAGERRDVKECELSLLKPVRASERASGDGDSWGS
jgi:hypothetical protein